MNMHATISAHLNTTACNKETLHLLRMLASVLAT